MIDEKLLKSIVIFFAGVTSFFITALAIAILPTWYEGLFWGVMICAIFTGIMYIGIRQHRLRKKIPKPVTTSHSQTDSTLEILIKMSVYKFETSLTKLILISALVVTVFFLLFFSQGEMNSSMMSFIITFSIGLFLVIVLVGFVVTGPYRKASELLKKNPLPRKFVLNTRGLSIPIEILTNNSFNLALKNNKTDVFIPWQDIESWEVYSGSGRSSDQHLLKLKGKSRELAGLFMPAMGIIRSEELRKMDHEIISFASRFLSTEINICTDDLGIGKG